MAAPRTPHGVALRFPSHIFHPHHPTQPRTLPCVLAVAFLGACTLATARTLHDASHATPSSARPVREAADGETMYVRHPARQTVLADTSADSVYTVDTASAAGAPRSAHRAASGRSSWSSPSSYAYDPDASLDATHDSVAALESSLDRAAGSVASAAVPLVDAAADVVSRATAGVTAAAARAAPSVQSFVKTAKEATADLTDATAGGGAVSARAAQSFAERTSAAAVGVAASLADGFVSGAGGPAGSRSVAAAPGKDLRSAVAAAVAGSVAAGDTSGPVLGAYAPAPER